jgi:filamentous hemagglutinin
MMKQIKMIILLLLLTTALYGNIPSLTYGIDISNSQTTHNNSNLNFNNLTTTSTKDTVINGATVSATNNLEVNTGGNLKVSSVQDTSSNSSQTVSVGTSNQSASIHKSSSTQTLVTSLKGGAVAINTQGNTNLSGATISAVDRKVIEVEVSIANEDDKLSLKEPKTKIINKTRQTDNGNLVINTGTLTYNNLSNRKISKTINIGGSSNSGSIGYNTQNSKTKTLSTIGSGTINIQDQTNSSDTTKLNRDTDKANIDIYDVKRDVKVEAEVDMRVFSQNGRDEVVEQSKDLGKNIQIIAKGLPEANSDNPIISFIGKVLDKASSWTGGLLPSHGQNGGLLGQAPILVGDDDINHRVIGNKNSDNVYINGIMNSEQDAKDGSDDIIGKNIDKQQWINPTHGAISDLFESAVDKYGNTIGIQTGISRQVGNLLNSNKNLNVYMHSQGNLVTKSGATNSRNNGHAYYSYGAPMKQEEVSNIFDMPNVPNQYNKPQYIKSGKARIYQNKGDPVSNPSLYNLLYNSSQHFTNAYGVSKDNNDEK